MFPNTPVFSRFLRADQSSRRGKSKIAYFASNSKTFRATPPVLTFSKTWQIASSGVSLKSDYRHGVLLKTSMICFKCIELVKAITFPVIELAVSSSPRRSVKNLS
jgi:hypothetical protein